MRICKKGFRRAAALFLIAVLVGNTVDLSTFTVSAAQESMQNEANSVSDNSVSDNGDTDQSHTITLQSDVKSSIPTVELPGNEELFAGYVDKMFYGGISLYGRSAREQLGDGSGTDTVAQKLYDFLKTEIESVAAGDLASTAFTMDMTTLGATYTYTNSDLGMDSILGVNEKGETVITEAAKTAASTAFWGQFNIAAVVDALMHDCPYELYWFDACAVS